MSNFSYRTQISDCNCNCNCINIMRVGNEGIMEMKKDMKSTEIITGWQKKKVPVWWLVKFWNPPDNFPCKDQERSNTIEQDTGRTSRTLSSIPVTMFNKPGEVQLKITKII